MFDITTDESVVEVSAGVMRITFTEIGMEVVEVLGVTNNSDRLYLTNEYLSENQRVALQFLLPPGAFGVGFEPGTQDSRFMVSQDGTTVIDTQPLRPGTDEIFFSYMIPYTDGAIIEQEFLYTLNGPFHLLIEAGQVALESDLFASSGEPVDMGRVGI